MATKDLYFSFDFFTLVPENKTYVQVSHEVVVGCSKVPMVLILLEAVDLD